MRVTFLAFSLAACTGGPSETDTSGETGTIDTDNETDVPVPMGRLEGIVIDEDGTPQVGARVNFCRGVCITAETDASGAFGADVPAQTGSFYVREDTTLLDAIVPLAVAEDQTRTVNVTLFEPDVNLSIPATSEEMTLLPGFRLTFGADVLQPALFEELGTRIHMASLLESELLPLEVEPAHGAFVAGYYFAPFEAYSTAGLPFSIDNTFGLAANTALVAYAASGPDLYTWLPAGELAVSSDGTVIEGGSLPILTTLVIFQAE